MITHKKSAVPGLHNVQDGTKVTLLLGLEQRLDDLSGEPVLAVIG
jgi:hypothetical protein